MFENVQLMSQNHEVLREVEGSLDSPKIFRFKFNLLLFYASF